MSPGPYEGLGTVRAVLDADGRLIEAEPPLAELHRAAGGRQGGMFAVPQIAALARLARRLGIPVSRAAIAADEDRDLELWVRVEPQEERTLLAVSGWHALPARGPHGLPSAEREADFARAAADWVWETDESLRITMVGQGAIGATGRAQAELAGKPLTSLFRFREHDDGSLPILLALAERRRFENQRAELRNPERAPYRLSGVPLVDGNGRFAGFRGSATAAESVKTQAANDEAPFDGDVGSALRGPLDQIIAQAESIGAATEGPLSSDYAGYAADIATAGRHLLSLVDDLGDVQTIEGQGFRTAAEPIDLAHVARQAATLLAVRAAERRVRLSAPPAELMLPATGDHRRAFQILVNLIGNAIRYSPEGETVQIAGECREDGVQISVTDRGKGVAPEDQARIFEKFVRVDPSEPGGTGLGLYIARRLARAMRGEIDLLSAPGLGARFTLRLPT